MRREVADARFFSPYHIPTLDFRYLPPASGETESTRNPSRNTVRAKAAHVLQASAAHWEVANKVPDQSDELADGGDEGEEEILALYQLA